MKLPGVVREVNAFALVGVTATACQVGVTLAAHRWLGAQPIVASLLGYLASVSLSYLGNSRLTFRRPALHGPQFARFAAISLAGLGVNLGVVYLCTHILGWPLWMAMAPVVLTVPACTFVLSKFWAFRTASPEAVS
jgi:putative flippase GtrA